MVDSVKREDDVPDHDSSHDTSMPLVKDLGALSLKQNSKGAPIKEAKEIPRTVSSTIVFRRGKPKGNTLTLDLPEILLPCNKFFLAQHDDGRLEIYCWITPGTNLGHLYRVDPDDGAFADRRDAAQAFTIGSTTYEPNIQDQELYMRVHSGFQPVHLFLDFWHARAHYFERILQTPAMSPNLPGHDLIDSEPPHLHHNASQQETSTTGTNASASGPSSAYEGFGIPESDLTSSPMILRVPKGVDSSNPNASDRLQAYAEMFRRKYDERADKTLKVSCFCCSKLQKELRPSSLVRHLGPHGGIKDYACNQCVEGRFNTKQQLDRHKTSHHGVPSPTPKVVKARAKAAKMKAAKH
ncbi:hypothetical protein FS749_004757 [Ceratobasidium sp. UAMH 11750]|nr:hypothetical protein FS749_004757 [Ceratobasidium sp. UAMH 11750]